MTEARCLQESIGSCGGCPIQEIALEKRVLFPVDQEHVLIDRIQKNLCPEGNTMQIPNRYKRAPI